MSYNCTSVWQDGLKDTGGNELHRFLISYLSWWCRQECIDHPTNTEPVSLPVCSRSVEAKQTSLYIY